MAPNQGLQFNRLPAYQLSLRESHASTHSRLREGRAIARGGSAIPLSGPDRPTLPQGECQGSELNSPSSVGTSGPEGDCVMQTGPLRARQRLCQPSGLKQRHGVGTPSQQSLSSVFGASHRLGSGSWTGGSPGLAPKRLGPGDGGNELSRSERRHCTGQPSQQSLSSGFGVSHRLGSGSWTGGSPGLAPKRLDPGDGGNQLSRSERRHCTGQPSQQSLSSGFGASHRLGSGSWTGGSPGLAPKRLDPGNGGNELSRSERRHYPNYARRGRRGVTLLFVVSMIVLFLLMGTAFVIVSNNFYGSSKKRLDRDLFKVDSQPYIEAAFYDLLRGPDLNNAGSPLRGHSLLEDMYGYGFSASIASASSHSSGHFITLQLNGDARRIIDGQPYTPAPVPGGLNGLVLTLVSGDANGLSTRIIDHQVSGTGGSVTHTFVVMPHWLNNQFAITDAGLLVGQRVVVNGRPFAGTGAGHYDPATPLDQPRLSTQALAPDQRGRSRDDLLGVSGDGYFSAQSGGSIVPNSQAPNEPYDAFDYQNMFLAGLRINGEPVKPSFHRQELTDNSPITGRADFRAFRRGGPDDDGVMVDNNLDGQPEGIWMDIGFPVRTSPDGRCFKPLISYTVLDLDSRINVNAHGNLLQVDPNMSDVSKLLHGTAPAALSRGQGLGPAEIQMHHVLGAGSGAVMQGRYGPDGQPGQAGVRDRWSGYKLFGLPDQAFTDLVPGTVGHHYGSTLDLFGRFAFGYFDIRDVSDSETPISMPMASVGISRLTPTETVDSPYEMNFSQDAFFGPIDATVDTPYTPRELEGVLRPFDVDSRLLPKRLLNNVGGSALVRNLITTDSFEVPTLARNPVGQLSRILEQGPDADTLVGVDTSQPNRETFIRDQLVEMLPAEFFRGLPLDINRPFGDGIDNNSNGVIDEIGESDTLTHPDGSTQPFDHDNDSSTASDSDTLFARSYFAKRLYVTTLLMTERVDRNGDGNIDLDDWYDFDDDGDVDVLDLIEYRKVIAQWAVNVVDFRDSDSIMTSFEVDLNPFNGWDVDSDITTTETLTESTATSGPIEMRQVFWGTERPELLITESFASHDTRAQDLNYESTEDGSTGQLVGEGDTDLDSHLVPKVSAFFELYNPWVINDANQIRPGELYDVGRNGVDLQRTSPDGGSPVWRLVVTEVNDPDTGVDELILDPDRAGNNEGNQQQQQVRRIYFAKPAIDSGPEVYYPEESIIADPVEPGLYAVVGTAGTKVGDRYDTYFGRLRAPDALDSENLHDRTRRISLDPVAGQLEIVQPKPNDPFGGGFSDLETIVREVTVIPIGRNGPGWERELGVSDPVYGYAAQTDPRQGYPIDLEVIADGAKFVESATTGSPVDYAFDEPIDRLLDPDHYDEFLAQDGLRPSYRVVHLQRLANPNNSFHPSSNPYRTIDSSVIDLFVFNGVDRTLDPSRTPGTMAFTTMERRAEDNVEPTEVAEGRHRLLFRNSLQGRQTLTASLEEDYGHVLDYNLTHSLGVLNTAFQMPGASDQRPFACLTWNNRPFASQLELANVPFPSSFQLPRAFNVADETRDVYSPLLEPVEETGAINLSSAFPHLLNFYADKIDGEANGPSLHRLLDVTEVPSRFVGTESFVNPSTFADDAHSLTFGLATPFDRISNYRYPGKININTITDQRVWRGLMGDRYSAEETGVSYAEWQDSLQGTAAVSDFGNPYRPSYASNLVPDASLVVDPVDVGLFRQDAATGRPLFDYHLAEGDSGFLAATDSQRAAYFRNDLRQRLGNLVTNRSSVFAVWVTVGYFEVQPDGSLKPGPNQAGIEIGKETGEVHRGRGFFLVDRSIPVAAEPGKNHNVDRAVLVKSIVE